MLRKERMARTGTSLLTRERNWTRAMFCGSIMKQNSERQNLI
jgi:hypothetical protein